VAHTQRGLEDLARAARARSNAKILAVTGSAGKTTTKEILRLACNALGRTHASAASYNNHWGVPLSLASLPRDAEYGIFEVGMNHFGELRNLVGFVRPHVALVTTIAPAHLEFFGNCESIADAKSEIFEGLEPGGAALIPADSAYADRLMPRAKQAKVARIVSFGEKGDARLMSFVADGEGMRVKADILGTAVDAYVGAPGAHIAQNVVGALAAVALLDGDVLNAAAALKNFTALKGRGARFDANGVHVIDESYNANPASMAAAMALLGAASRPQDRGAGRHAGNGRGRPGPSCRACRTAGRQQGRSGVRLRGADEGIVGCAAQGAARRLCRKFQTAGAAGDGGGKAGRHGAGQRLQRGKDVGGD
jgi:UDP-N-acetylmuramoyl-tripeptide--D-alanyl-D-alanine ligase